MADRKSDFALPTLDDLFSTQEERDDARLEKIRDMTRPLRQIRTAKFSLRVYALASMSYLR